MILIIKIKSSTDRKSMIKVSSQPSTISLNINKNINR